MGIDFEMLKNIDPQCEIKINETLNNHTTFKIGGPADVLVIPSKVEGVQTAIELCQEAGISYVVLGNGSNVLVTDKGIRGMVIKISEPMSHVEISDESVQVEAGILLSSLAHILKDSGLKGMEFASGIPGTLGGAIFMNAGAYGGEMKDVVEWVDALTPEGEIKRFTKETSDFGYRTSIYKKEAYTVLRCGLKLEKGSVSEIKETIDDLTCRRVSKQPLDLPSAGSTFKRPEGHYAGQLIEEAGLRGVRFGDAQVSQKHCGFIVNRGQATCRDVLKLIEIIQKVVLDHSGVKLEREVQILGE